MMTVNINSPFMNVTEFLFAGLPWEQRLQYWLSVPLTLLLLLSVMANIILAVAIYREPSLHEPMYYFLCMLSLADLVLCLVTTPKILAILWLDARSISLPGCFTQMFFIHCLIAIESGIFIAMAFDRYIAICSPLRYNSVLTNRFVINTMVVITLQSLFVTVPVPIFTARLNYCSDYIIQHILCSNLAVAKLACEDISFNITYQMGIAWSVMGSDLMIIFLSYCLILRAALRLQGKGHTRKALSTCISHLIVILFFYSIIIVLAVSKKSKQYGATEGTIILNILHFCVPPTLNPMVYGFRTTLINQGIRNIFRNACLGTR